MNFSIEKMSLSTIERNIKFAKFCSSMGVENQKPKIQNPEWTKFRRNMNEDLSTECLDIKTKFTFTEKIRALRQEEFLLNKSPWREKNSLLRRGEKSYTLFQKKVEFSHFFGFFFYPDVIGKFIKFLNFFPWRFFGFLPRSTHYLWFWNILNGTK